MADLSTDYKAMGVNSLASPCCVCVCFETCNTFIYFSCCLTLFLLPGRHQWNQCMPLLPRTTMSSNRCWLPEARVSFLMSQCHWCFKSWIRDRSRHDHVTRLVWQPGEQFFVFEGLSQFPIVQESHALLGWDGRRTASTWFGRSRFWTGQVWPRKPTRCQMPGLCFASQSCTVLLWDLFLNFPITGQPNLISSPCLFEITPPANLNGQHFKSGLRCWLALQMLHGSTKLDHGRPMQLCSWAKRWLNPFRRSWRMLSANEGWDRFWLTKLLAKRSLAWPGPRVLANMTLGTMLSPTKTTMNWCPILIMLQPTAWQSLSV